jgi:hypothetical protein
VLQIRVGLLDDRVPGVGLVRGDRVQGAGGEEGVEAVVRIEQGGVVQVLLFNSGIRRTTQPLGDVLAVLP